MKNTTRRIVAGTALAAALTGVTGGIAQAETPVYVLPGVDAGTLLDPTIDVPTQALKPVVGLFGLIGG